MLLQSDRKDSYISGRGLSYVAAMIIRTVFSMEKHSCVCLLIEMKLQIEDRISPFCCTDSACWISSKHPAFPLSKCRTIAGHNYLKCHYVEIHRKATSISTDWSVCHTAIIMRTVFSLEKYSWVCLLIMQLHWQMVGSMFSISCHRGTVC